MHSVRAYNEGAAPSRLSTAHAAIGPLLAAAAYFLGAHAAFFIGTLSDKIFAPFWPPNSVLFCIFLFASPSRWWTYLLATLPVHAWTEYDVGMSSPQMLVAFATNVLVAAISAIAMRRFLVRPPWVGDLRRMAFFILVAVFVSPAAVAFAGAFIEILGGGPAIHYTTYWLHWFAANAFGSITLGAVVAAWHGRAHLPLRFSARLFMEIAMLGAALILCSAVAFELALHDWASGFLPAILYVPLPIILWITVRFGTRGATIAVFIIALVIIVRSLSGTSIFAGHSIETNVLGLQFFVIALAVPVLLLGASVDQARDVERSVGEQQEQIEFVATNANIGFWQFDPSTGRFWLSDHCRSMLGMRHMAIASRADVIQVIHPDDRASFNGLLQRTGRPPATPVSEMRCIMADGRTKWFLVRAHPISGEDGLVARVTGFFADISLQKAWELEAALNRKEVTHLMRIATLGELSGAIAHELNQPLTAILANAKAGEELLRTNPKRLDDIRAILGDIVLEDVRAGTVIERLRKLMKKAESRREPLDLNAIVTTTLALLHSEMILRKLSVKTDLAATLPRVIGDPVQIQQVLLNVVMNAAEAMTAVDPGGRVLTISTRVANTGVEMIVADRGPGLSPELRHRIFEPFFTTKEHGLGLGLSICAGIATSHRGELILSDNPGGGTVAILRIPAAVPRDAAPQETASS